MFTKSCWCMRVYVDTRSPSLQPSSKLLGFRVSHQGMGLDCLSGWINARPISTCALVFPKLPIRRIVMFYFGCLNCCDRVDVAFFAILTSFGKKLTLAGHVATTQACQICSATQYEPYDAPGPLQTSHFLLVNAEQPAQLSSCIVSRQTPKIW